MTTPLERFIEEKVEEFGYRPHAPEELRKLLLALLGEVEKEVEKIDTEPSVLGVKVHGEKEVDFCRGAEAVKNHILRKINPREL